MAAQAEHYKCDRSMALYVQYLSLPLSTARFSHASLCLTPLLSASLCRLTRPPHCSPTVTSPFFLPLSIIHLSDYPHPNPNFCTLVAGPHFPFISPRSMPVPEPALAPIFGTTALLCSTSTEPLLTPTHPRSTPLCFHLLLHFTWNIRTGALHCPPLLLDLTPSLLDQCCIRALNCPRSRPHFASTFASTSTSSSPGSAQHQSLALPLLSPPFCWISTAPSHSTSPPLTALLCFLYLCLCFYLSPSFTLVPPQSPQSTTNPPHRSLHLLHFSSLLPLSPPLTPSVQHQHPTPTPFSLPFSAPLSSTLFWISACYL